MAGTMTPIAPGTPTGATPTPGPYPLTPLDVFRREMGYNPWHFWGLANASVPVTSACNTVVRQYAWQGADAAGRSEILDAIETAEVRLREYLGYSVAPHYVEETLPLPRYHDHRLWRLNSIDADGRWAAVRLSEGYVQAAGVESLSLIETAAVTYSDADGDGLNDTFTVSVATSETDPDKIGVYFAAADRLDDEAVGERWRIQPVKVAISGGTATITGRSWLLVKPIKYEGVGTSSLDPAESANFVSTVEVCVRTTDPDGTTVDTAQAKLVWETAPWPDWALCCSDANSNDTDPAAEAYAVARVALRDSDAGIVAPASAVYNSDDGVWHAAAWETCRPPDRVTVRYYAGYPLEAGQVARRLSTIVARLAAAELARRICACDVANRALYHWQFDLSRSAGANDEQFAISAQDLDNPLGTRRGQVYAWKEIRGLRQLTGLFL